MKPVWSSWWIPKKERSLFEDSSPGELATLTKYDLVRHAKNSRLGSAADFERNAYNPKALVCQTVLSAGK